MHNNKAKLFEHLTSKGFMPSDAWDAVDIAFKKPPGAPKIVFISHAVGGNTPLNMIGLRDIIRRIHRNHPDVVPFCPYYADVEALGDECGRQRGMRSVRVILQSGIVDELWLTGKEITSGMHDEWNLCRELGIPVLNKIGKL